MIRSTTFSVIIALLAIIVSLITPEIREWIFGEKAGDVVQPSEQEFVEKERKKPKSLLHDEGTIRQPEIKIDKSQDTESSDVEISLKDKNTKKPIPNVIITIEGLPGQLLTDKYGKLLIPKAIVEKYGVYNSVKASFEKEGYENRTAKYCTFRKSNLLFK